MTFSRYQPIIHDWCAFTDALARPLPTCIWANTLRISPAGLADVLRRDGIDFEPVVWQPGAFKLSPDFQPSRHWGYLAGLYHVQEEVSLLPVTLLNPQPGERVLDLCAAPGGKTAQISVAMTQQGTVLANDIDMNRMRAVRHAVERLGLINISTTVCNGANYPKAAGLFDRVLVDAPCSCEGTTRKNSSMTGVGEAVSHKLSGVQRALLRKAVQLCRPGGRIVYATCTYAPEENEQVVDAILQEFGDAVLRLLPAHVLDFTAEPGLTEWNGQQLHPSLQHALRVWPHLNDTGGFFVAVLEKLGDSIEVEASGLPASFPLLPADLVAEVVGRFGIALDDAGAATPYQQGRRRAYLVNAEHRPPAQPAPDASGLLLAKTAVKFPKLSTAAAMLLGSAAAQNFVDVDEAQMWAYLNRKQFVVTAAQTAACREQGYVLVRHQGYTLGVGVFFPPEQLVASLFPKAWSPDKGNGEL